ncbi:putative sterigmatocystin biosynthesis P450 monooxygenase stcS [Cladorrhinum samala]|uniref:Sterigmatocystin biosynthesis P450 monooxygenase stcS n=1 Tax=Cladorrhinum samala TaxID=585594 RepID=A0AAV9HSK9_9PEZI|nr:putative sterigmatocystin biosynthesis P450 monooxygenase stcS [Cladorrhinum samala]
MASALMLAALVLPVVVCLYAAARRKRFSQYEAFPQPSKPSLLWGHMQTLQKALKRGPEGLHFDVYAHDLLKSMPGSPSLLFLDLRPITWPMAVIARHEVAEQISRSSKLFPYSTPKSPTMAEFLRLIGPRSFLVHSGDDWKEVRKRFNPGFAPQHLMTLLPCILDKTSIFVDRLDGYARSGEDFLLLQAVIDLTFDIIGAVVMDVDFNAQLAHASGRRGDFIPAYEELVKTYAGRNPGIPWFFFVKRLWKRWRLSSKVDKVIRDVILDKFAEQQRGQKAAEGTANGISDKAKARSVLNLSLQGREVLDDALLEETVDSIKTFMFAGHDTTSIVLSWALYYLSLYPSCREALAAELDDVFGPDSDPAAVKGKLSSPGGHELINRMPYTTAVIKETLRLRPPASTARMARPGSGLVVRTPEGQDLCLDGMLIYVCASIIQRDRNVYGETADEFVPERWLNDKSGIMSATSNVDVAAPAAGAEKTIPASAWRAFERGPRNCIGQDLATIEARVILAMVARRYEFVKVGLGELERDEKGLPVMEESGRHYKVKSEVFNTSQITSKPVDSMKMKVKIR